MASDEIINNLVYYLVVSEKLIKKYGKLLFVSEVLEQIKKESIDLYYFLLLLKSSKKTSVTNIKIIISLLKKQSKNYSSEFVVSVDTSVDQGPIQKYLEMNFDASLIEHKIVEGEEVFVAWEWRYYKRSLEQDVKKLLDI